MVLPLISRSLVFGAAPLPPCSCCSPGIAVRKLSRMSSQNEMSTIHVMISSLGLALGI